MVISLSGDNGKIFYTKSKLYHLFFSIIEDEYLSVFLSWNNFNGRHMHAVLTAIKKQHTNGMLVLKS